MSSHHSVFFFTYYYMYFICLSLRYYLCDFLFSLSVCLACEQIKKEIESTEMSKIESHVNKFGRKMKEKTCILLFSLTYCRVFCFFCRPLFPFFIVVRCAKCYASKHRHAHTRNKQQATKIVVSFAMCEVFFSCKHNFFFFHIKCLDAHMASF